MRYSVQLAFTHCTRLQHTAELILTEPHRPPTRRGKRTSPGGYRRYESQEDSHMDSMDNVRERFEVLEQRTEHSQPHTQALEAQTRTAGRRLRGWRLLPWRVPVVAALGLALVLPLAIQAKTFHCGAGDVQCLIDAINEANANGKKNTIRLAAGTYTLTGVDNEDLTTGATGLPVMTSPFTITGAGAESTIIERAL